MHLLDITIYAIRFYESIWIIYNQIKSSINLFFRILLQSLESFEASTSVLPRMIYGVNSVRPLDPLWTVTFVTYICVKPVLESYLRSVQRTQRVVILKEGINPYRQPSPQNYVNYCEGCNIRICASF